MHAHLCINSFYMDDVDYQLQTSSCGVKLVLTGQGSLWLFRRALLAALLKPMQKVRKAQSKVSFGSRFVSEGQRCLESDKGVAKKGSGEGKGLHGRCIHPTVSSSASSPTSAFHSHGNWFLAGILMVWIPIYQNMAIVAASYCTGPVVQASV